MYASMNICIVYMATPERFHDCAERFIVCVFCNPGEISYPARRGFSCVPGYTGEISILD